MEELACHPTLPVWKLWTQAACVHGRQIRASEDFFKLVDLNKKEVSGPSPFKAKYLLLRISSLIQWF